MKTALITLAIPFVFFAAGAEAALPKNGVRYFQPAQPMAVLLEKRATPLTPSSNCHVWVDVAGQGDALQTAAYEVSVRYQTPGMKTSQKGGTYPALDSDEVHDWASRAANRLCDAANSATKSSAQGISSDACPVTVVHITGAMTATGSKACPAFKR